MKKNNITVDFFLGSNTENGFYSHFAQLQDIGYGIKPIILIGGPGTGKSSIMKKISDYYKKTNELIENIHCSSDPYSLDSVILHNEKYAVLDGTAPHIMNAKYPLAFENVVNLLDCSNKKDIEKNIDEIVKINGEIKQCHSTFCNLLKLANSFLNSNRILIQNYVDFEKLNKNALRIVHKEFKKQNQKGKEHTRMISAFTPNGLITYKDTVKKLCSKVWVINDEHRVCSPIILEIIRNNALQNGYEIYTCYSAFNAKDEIDALLIPSLSLAFVCSNKYTDFSDLNKYKIMNVTRFIDKDVFKKYKHRLSLYKKTANQILKDASDNLKNAKTLHDKLEEYYINNINFKKLDKKFVDVTGIINS